MEIVGIANIARFLASYKTVLLISALPSVTPSAELLKDMRGSTGPGGGEITALQEGASPHNMVGG